MKSLFKVPVIAVAVALVLAGCGGDDVTDDASESSTTETATDTTVPEEEEEDAVAPGPLDFAVVESLTPESGYVGHEKEDRCSTVKWAENSTGIQPEELRDKSTFFRQMDCYIDDSFIPTIVQAAVFAEFSDEESVAAFVDGPMGIGRQIIISGTTVFMAYPEFAADFAENVRESCGCELVES